VQWQWLTVGSIAATLFWLVATLGVSFYVSTFGDYNKTYGSLAAVVILQLWLFVSAYIVLLGAQINAEAERQTSAHILVEEVA
jgi:membrane protein